MRLCLADRGHASGPCLSDALQGVQAPRDAGSPGVLGLRSGHATHLRVVVALPGELADGAVPQPDVDAGQRAVHVLPPALHASGGRAAGMARVRQVADKTWACCSTGEVLSRCCHAELRRGGVAFVQPLCRRACPCTRTDMTSPSRSEALLKRCMSVQAPVLTSQSTMMRLQKEGAGQVLGRRMCKFTACRMVRDVNGAR